MYFIQSVEASFCDGHNVKTHKCKNVSGSAECKMLLVSLSQLPAQFRLFADVFRQYPILPPFDQTVSQDGYA